MTNKEEALKRTLEQLEFFDRSAHQHGCLWQKPLITAIKEALREHAMREVQRLGQEIEQEPVAIKRMKEWIEYLKRKSDFGQHMKIPSEMSAGTCWELAIELEQFINTAPPQRQPLTPEQQEEMYQMTDNLSDCRTCYFQGIADAEAAHNIGGAKP